MCISPALTLWQAALLSLPCVHGDNRGWPHRSRPMELLQPPDRETIARLSPLFEGWSLGACIARGPLHTDLTRGCRSQRWQAVGWCLWHGLNRLQELEQVSATLSPCR